MHALISALGKQRQVDLSKFEASLVYQVLGQPELHRETLSQKNKKKTKKTKHPKKYIEGLWRV